MSESALKTAAVPEPDILRPPPSSPRPPARASLLWRLRWPLGALLLAAFSFGLVRWAGTRPGYDPYGWMIWGYQTLHASLDLGGAPSWKPMTWLFDVPFALFGHAQLWLWMTTSVTFSLAGAMFAGRLALRLARHLGLGPRSALAGAIFAGLALLGIDNYLHYVLSVQSDPMIVTLCLAAADAHLCRRPRLALSLLVLASLGRPEAWPFLGLYGLYGWRRVPGMRPWVIGGFALIPLLWFGIPWITNGRPLVAGQLAENSPRELHQNKIVGTLHRFVELHYLQVEVLALLAVAVAWRRRSRLVLLLGGAVVLWVLVEVAFVLHGWPGVPRYLFEPAGLTAVLAGVAIAWLIHEVPRLRVGRLRGLPLWSGALLAAIAAAALVPGAVHRLRVERTDLVHEHHRTATINHLDRTVEAVGGAHRVRACGQPVITIEYVSILAWYMQMNTGVLGHKPGVSVRRHGPHVFFLPLHNGWSVLPQHPRSPGCTALRSSLVFTGRHPNGVRTRYIPAPFH